MAAAPPTNPGSAEDDLIENLPAPIVKKLRAMVRRVRRVQLLRGVFSTLATAALAVIAIMLVSVCFTILSPAIHAALTGAGLLAIGHTVYRSLFLPLREPIPLAHIARVMEARHPELDERLSTAIGLLGSTEPDSLRGSKELVSKIVDSAVADAKRIRPKREFTNRSSRRYVIIFASAAAVLLVGFLVFPGQSSRLATRAIAPFSKVGNAFADHLDVTPGNLRIPSGDPVTIWVDVFGADAERAEILRTNPGGAEMVETMSLTSRPPFVSSRQFAITFPSVTEPFSYRIRSGRAVSASHEVTAVTRPEIRRLEVSYEPPGYTGIAPYTVTELNHTITAVTGTKVQIVANFDRPLESAVLKIDGNPHPAISDTSSDSHNPRSAWRFEIANDTDGTWELALTDIESIPSRANKLPIRAIPDQAPALQLLSERKELRVRPDERISLRYEAEEDFGITAIKLEIAGQNHPMEQALPTSMGTGRYRGTAILDISELPEEVSAAGSFEVYVSVTDNHPTAQETKAGPITVTLDAGADSLAEQVVTEQRKSIQSSIQNAIGKLESAKLIANKVPRQLLKPDTIPQGTLEQLGEIQSLTGEAEATIRDTATMATAPSSLFKRLGASLEKIADDHLATARQAAEEIPLSDKKITRVHHAHKINKQLDEGIADLNVAVREVKQRTSQASLLAKMSELGDRQQQLADKLAAASSPAETERLLEQQAELAKALEQLANSSERSVADQLQDARKIAADLADAASQLSAEQKKLTQMLNQAADPAQRNAAIRGLVEILEREQRAIGQNIASIGVTGNLDDGLRNSGQAADALQENRLTDAAKIAAINGNFLQEMAQPKLAESQKDIATQIRALDQDRLDDALATRQSALAAEAEQLAQKADNFRNRAESLADPSALQQVQRASSHANDAARAAHQASSQLGGDSSTGAFEFARAPDSFAPNQNTNPNAPPAPTQAGVAPKKPGDPGFRNDQLPDMSEITGTSESPFSQGEIAETLPPPAFREGTISTGGGDAPMGSAPLPSQILPAQSLSKASGQDSITSAAQQPAMQAQHGLADASTALTNAAGSLAQQANSPGAQRPPDIDQKMLEAARRAAQAAIEKNPELAAKIAKAVAKNLNTPTQPDQPAPDVKDWQDIRGKVKSGLAARAKNQTPEEYRELVKNYFKEIARRSSETAEQ